MSALSTMGLLNTPAFSASKAKPDLPIGEETEHSAPASRPAEKNSQSTAPSQKKAEKDTAAGATSPVKPISEKELDDKKNPPQGEEKDPYAETPAAHGEEKAPSSPSTSTGEHSESHKETSKPAQPEAQSATDAKPKLLEGKVDPATRAQGKGLIWFAVVFILLSVAIFVFT